MSIENLKIRGFVSFEIGENGKVTHTHEVRNLVTNVGKEFFTQRILGETDREIGSVGLGSGSVPASESDTALAAQTSIVLLDSLDRDSNIITAFSPFPEGEGTGDVQEVGLFDTEDNLLCRTVLDNPFNKTFSQFINVSWKLQIG